MLAILNIWQEEGAPFTATSEAQWGLKVPSLYSPRHVSGPLGWAELGSSRNEVLALSDESNKLVLPLPPSSVLRTCMDRGIVMGLPAPAGLGR